ncbi:hypothetical protein Ciccas_007949 [Cichlidogyrus casuarinus]|uniref:C2H2-type domain-containing protein n=1 Tax=Cichlidogyrus casuarinus TaxID=1844966 RepID=A0ABD2Q1N5_9PLAT
MPKAKISPSPKSKDSKKSDSKKKDAKSKSKGSDPKNKKCEKKEEIVIDYPPRERKVRTEDLELLKLIDAGVKTFRCLTCKLVFQSIEKLIIHSCWKKYFEERIYLVDRRLYRCVRCANVFLDFQQYTDHQCLNFDLCRNTPSRAEQLIILNKWQHLDFYIKWRRENFHEYLVAICSKCGDKFYSSLAFILHSCCQNPRASRFFLCKRTKEVSWTYQEFESCLTVTHEEQTQCVCTKNLALFAQQSHMKITANVWHIAFPEQVLQLVSFLVENGQYTLSDSKLESFKCDTCQLTFDTMELFLLHTCIVGHVMDPLALHCIIFCQKCSCTFLRPDWFIKHANHCDSANLVLVRLNTEDELRMFLKSWLVGRAEEKRGNALFRCRDCCQVYCQFIDLLRHRRQVHKETLLPIRLLETFRCTECDLVMFYNVELIAHRKNCRVACQAFISEINYSMEEALEALKSWRKIGHNFILDQEQLRNFKYQTLI